MSAIEEERLHLKDTEVEEYAIAERGEGDANVTVEELPKEEDEGSYGDQGEDYSGMDSDDEAMVSTRAQ